MAKSILSKSIPASKQFNTYPLFPCQEFERQVSFLYGEILSVMNNADLYPNVKNSTIFKKLVKLSQEFVKLSSTNGGV